MNPKIEEEIVEAIKKVYDPEIPVNIYELGLIYNIDVKKDGLVDIKTDESGEFHFRLSEKGNQIAEELIKDSGDNNA